MGSIGVTAAGYGFVGTMEKLGVERRTYTAGEHKAFWIRSRRKSQKRPRSGRACSIPRIVSSSPWSSRGAATPEGQGASRAVQWPGLVGRAGQGTGAGGWLGSASYVAREIVGEKELVDFTVQSRRSIASPSAWVPAWLSAWLCGWVSKGHRCADIKPTPVIGHRSRM